MTRKWRLRVRPDGINIDLRAWEVAVLVHLRERLPAATYGSMAVGAWRSLEDYLFWRITYKEAMNLGCNVTSLGTIG
ncbi:hypothetical protein [Mesorhizobium sp.]|uniref:hypothetical protein n=1 Tax=Mesorhizobium sp. TaxID=1871066 RepID=UPI0025EE9749|nr:hypothetical protein [Mesorhizobium sp.]